MATGSAEINPIANTLSQSQSRRGALRFLAAAAGAGSLGLLAIAETDARRKGNKGKRGKGRRRGRGGSGTTGGGTTGGNGGNGGGGNGGGGNPDGGDPGEGGGGGGGGGYAPDAEEQAFLDLINAYRAQMGVAPLALQSQLGEAAAHHAQVMASQNSMHHVADVRAYQQSFGYNPTWWAENIAAGYETASAVFNGWKNSPPHNQNMLSANFTEIGIGRAYNPNSTYGWYWCTEFGRR
jgi:hypothetical protein